MFLGPSSRDTRNLVLLTAPLDFAEAVSSVG